MNKKIIIGLITLLILVILIVCIVVISNGEKNNGNVAPEMEKAETNNSENLDSNMIKDLNTTGPSGYPLITLSSVNTNTGILELGSILDLYTSIRIKKMPNRININGTSISLDEEVSMDEIYALLENLNKTCPIKNIYYSDIEDVAEGTLGLNKEWFKEAIDKYNGGRINFFEVEFYVPYNGNYDVEVKQEQIDIEDSQKFSVRLYTNDSEGEDFYKMSIYNGGVSDFTQFYEKPERQLSGVIYSYDEDKLDVMIDNYYSVSTVTYDINIKS